MNRKIRWPHFLFIFKMLKAGILQVNFINGFFFKNFFREIKTINPLIFFASGIIVFYSQQQPVIFLVIAQALDIVPAFKKRMIFFYRKIFTGIANSFK